MDEEYQTPILPRKVLSNDLKIQGYLIVMLNSDLSWNFGEILTQLCKKKLSYNLKSEIILDVS